MSTEFVLTDDPEFVGFVRWAGAPTGQPRFEFGTVTNFETVVRMIRNGFEFEPLGGGRLASDPEMTPEGIEWLVAEGRATFGEFPITVAVGSGDMFRFGVEE